MSNLAISCNGDYMLVSAEDGSTGEQVVLINLMSTTIWTEVLRVTGTACNVIAWPGQPKLMAIYGHMGANIQIYKYDIATDTLTNISPAALGAAVMNSLTIAPSRPGQLIAGLDGTLTFYLSSDGGDTWDDTSLAASGTIDALWAFYAGDYWPDGILYSLNVSSVASLIYTPNELVSSLSLMGTIPTGDVITALDGV